MRTFRLSNDSMPIVAVVETGLLKPGFLFSKSRWRYLARKEWPKDKKARGLIVISRIWEQSNVLPLNSNLSKVLSIHRPPAYKFLTCGYWSQWLFRRMFCVAMLTRIVSWDLLWLEALGGIVKCSRGEYRIMSNSVVTKLRNVMETRVPRRGHGNPDRRSFHRKLCITWTTGNNC